MRSRCSGYSTLEMLVSLLIVSLILAALYTVLLHTQASFEAQGETMALRQSARVIVDQLATELRMAGFDIGNLPEALVDARADSVTFVLDVDNGSAEPPCGAAIEDAVDGGAERFSYRVQSGNLLRSVDCWDGASWSNEYTDQTFAENLLSTAPLFRYYESDGNELVLGGGSLSAAQRALVKTIVIAVEVESPDRQLMGKPNVDFRIRTRVTLRNAQS